MLFALQRDIQGLKVSLENHIKTSQTQISQIKDEIVSVKKHVTVMTADTNQTVENIADQTHIIQTEVVKQADLMQTRLANVFDSLKTLHVKESNTKNSHSAQQRNIYPESPSYSKQTETDARTTQRKTLIVGDSILNKVNKNGLNNDTEPIYIPGGEARDIRINIQGWDMREYANVIIYVGGNDVSPKFGQVPMTSTLAELKETTDWLRKQRCKVYICTVCPRSDADVTELNNEIRRFCRDSDAHLIDVSKRFTYGDGSVVQHFFQQDGIHLSDRGSRTLVSAINQLLSIVKPRTQAPEQRYRHNADARDGGQIRKQAPEQRYRHNADARDGGQIRMQAPEQRYRHNADVRDGNHRDARSRFNRYGVQTFVSELPQIRRDSRTKYPAHRPASYYQ